MWIESDRTTIMDSLSCILFLAFKHKNASFYQFYAKIYICIKKCSARLLPMIEMSNILWKMT